MGTSGTPARIFALVGVVLAFRWLMAGQVGLGDDEAYYWLWSQRPSWGYFDHPGGIAWLIRGATELGGSAPGQVRLPVVVGGGALALILAGAVPTRHRLAGALLGLLLPVLGLLGVFAAPDMPFLVAWLGTVLAAERLEKRPSLPLWGLVGLGLGVTLVFKLTGVLLGLGLVLWSGVDPAVAAGGGGEVPGLPLLVAMVVSTPTWWWNLQHGLPTLWFHAVGRHQHSISVGEGVAVWGLIHLVLLTPPVLWAVLASRRTERGRRLLWMAAPCWVVFTGAALLTPTKLHWWAPAWLTVLPAAVPLLHDRRRLWWPTVGFFAVLHGALLGLATHPPSPLVGWTAELRGWEALADRLTTAHPDADAWVTNRYQTASQLAYGPDAMGGPPFVALGAGLTNSPCGGRTRWTPPTRCW